MIRWLHRAVILVACGMVAACSAGGTTTGTTPSGTGVPITPSGTPPDAATILDHARHIALKDATFTLAGTAGAATGAAPSTIVTIAGHGTLTTTPNRSDIHFTSINLGIAATSAEVIIDQTNGIYANVPPLNQWVRVDPSVIGKQIVTTDFLNYDHMSATKLIDAEMLNGQTTWHLEGTYDSGTTTTNLPMNEDLWVRQDNYYPVKIDIHTVTSAATPGGDNRAVTEVVTCSAWDSGLKPVPLPTPILG